MVAWWSAAQPVLALAGELFARYVGIVSRIYATVVQIVAKIYTAVGRVVAQIVPLVQQVAESVFGLVEDVTDALQPLIDAFGDQLVQSVELAGKVIVRVMAYLIDQIKAAITEVRVLGRVAAAIMNNPANALDLEGTVRVARMETERDDRNRQKVRDEEARNNPFAGLGDKIKGGLKKLIPESKNAPQEGPILAYQPELLGVAEAMRKAQTAAMGEDKTLAAQQEQVRLAKEAAEDRRNLILAVNGLHGLGNLR